MIFWLPLNHNLNQVCGIRHFIHCRLILLFSACNIPSINQEQTNLFFGLPLECHLSIKEKMLSGPRTPLIRRAGGQFEIITTVIILRHATTFTRRLCGIFLVTLILHCPPSFQQLEVNNHSYPQRCSQLATDTTKICSSTRQSNFVKEGGRGMIRYNEKFWSDLATTSGVVLLTFS